MQLKCSFCSTPFALSKEEVELAIQKLTVENQAHYDAHCPKCRRANRITKKTFQVNPLYRKMLESK
jgi:phage FluMu protein Com